MKFKVGDWIIHKNDYPEIRAGGRKRIIEIEARRGVDWVIYEYPNGRIHSDAIEKLEFANEELIKKWILNE